MDQSVKYKQENFCCIPRIHIKQTNKKEKNRADGACLQCLSLEKDIGRHTELLARQPNCISKPQVSGRPSLEKQKGWPLEK